MDSSVTQLYSALKNIHSSLCLPFTIDIIPVSEEQEPQLLFSKKLTLVAGETFTVVVTKLETFIEEQKDKEALKCFSKNEKDSELFPVDSEDIRRLRQIEGNFICSIFTNNERLVSRMEKFYESMECLEKPLLKSHYKAARTTIGNTLDFFCNRQREQFPVQGFIASAECHLQSDIIKEVMYMTPSIVGRLGVNKLARLSKELVEKYPSAYSESMQFLSEWYVSVFQRMEAAKTNIVEKLPKPPKEDYADRGSCSCCLRSIAVLPGGEGMAHHGYYRLGNGVQTGSCRGIDAPPLENSTKGLWAYVDDLKSMEIHLREDIKANPTPEKSPSRQDEDKWNEYKLQVNRDAELRRLQREITYFEKTGQEWDKRHAAGDVTPIIPVAYAERDKEQQKVKPRMRH